LPNLKTDEPVCPDKQLQCGNGDCIEKELFCDERSDCADGSDETACTVDQVTVVQCESQFRLKCLWANFYPTITDKRP
jgi:hypothetical protein